MYLLAHSMSSGKLKFPFEINDVDPDLNAELLKYFHGEKNGFVQVGPEKYFFPQKYRTEAEAYYNFQARPDDIWVVTFPRSGTTWTQEMVWLIANKLNFYEAINKPLTERFPFFEFPLFIHPEIKAELLRECSDDAEKLQIIEWFSTPQYQLLDEIDCGNRRFIKTHFPFSLLPPSVMAQKCKIIYVGRNPKDVAVSYYHLNRLFRTQGYVGDFQRFWGYFEKGLNPWMPYYSHIKEALYYRHFDNVLYLNYEDMQINLEDIILKVGDFLSCRLSRQGIDDLKNHLSIKNFRLNTSVNCQKLEAVGILNKGEAKFIRKGANGDILQDEFVENPKLLNNINKWIEGNQINILRN